MARRKKLNKKVALIGAAVLGVLAVLTVLAVGRLGGDPQKLMQDADAAMAAGDYDGARRSLSRAFDGTKDSKIRIDLLFKMARMYTLADVWPKVMSCWDRIVQEDPRNIKARLALLDARYLQADGQARLGATDTGLWKDVETRANELLEVVTEAGAATQDPAQWKVVDWEEGNPPCPPGPLGLYITFMRGRSLYQQASSGAVAAPQQGLDRAEADFRKVLESNPAAVDAYGYLSKVAAERARLSAAAGNLEGKAKALAEVDRILAEGVKAAGTAARSHLILLENRLDRVLKDGPQESVPQQLASLEPQYQILTQSFGSSAEVFGLVAKFDLIQAYYQGPDQRAATLDKAMEAARKAMDLDKTRIDYVLALADLTYRKAVLLNQSQEMAAASALARRALDLPGAKETSGPRAYVNKANACGIQIFLAHLAIDQILEADALTVAQARGQWLAAAEQAVHQIEQIIGTADDLEVLKWRGLLALARGDVDRAVPQLISVHDKGKAGSTARLADPWVAYVLGRIFMETAEQGYAARCLAESLRGEMGFNKPSAILDYLEVLGRLERWAHVTSGTNAYNIDAYERQFGPCARSRAIRIRALIGTNRIPDAERELTRLDSRDPLTIKVKLDLVHAKIRQVQGSLASAATGDREAGASGTSMTSTDPMSQQLRQFRDQEAELVTQQLEVDPRAVAEADMVTICHTLLERGRAAEARQKVDLYLATQPQSPTVLFQRAVLNEPDPMNVPEARRDALFEQVALKLADPGQRAVELISFYRQTGRIQQATDLSLKVMDDALQQGLSLADCAALRAPYDHPASLAAGYALDLALDRKDWILAEQILVKVRKGDLDGCQGKYFEARLSRARGDLQDALAKVDAALELRPVFAQGILFRAVIQDALGHGQAATEDMDRVSQLAPTNSQIAKGLASFLFNRCRRLDVGVAEERRAEAKQALERAIRLDPSDMTLLAMYADMIRSTEPLKAFQIYQVMYRQRPSAATAVALGGMATTLASAESQPMRKAALLDVAQAAFEQAYAAEPNDPAVIQGLAQVYRATGQADKADSLLAQSKNGSRSWRDLLRRGKVDQAKVVLEQTLARDSNSIDALQGLVLAAEMTHNAKDIEKYSDALVAAHDTPANRIDQILVFLRSRLFGQCDARIVTFKARYPGESRIAMIEVRVAMEQGRLSKAMGLVDQVCQSQGEGAEAWFFKGQISLWAGDVDQAIQALTKSKALKEDSRVRLVLAQAYAAAKRPDDSVAELKAVLGDKDFAWQAAMVLESLCTRLARTPDLEALYVQTERLFPGDIHWVGRAAAFEFSRGHYAKAVLLYSKICTPGSPAAYESDYAAACDGYLQALIAAAGDNADQLRAVIQKAGDLANATSKAAVLCRTAQARLKLGDKEGAGLDCRRAVEASGPSADAIGVLVRRLVEVMGADEVTQQARQILAENPGSFVGHQALLHVANAQRRYDDAVAEADRCMSLPGQEEVIKQVYLAQKAQTLTVAYEQTSDKRYRQEAITQYESLVSKMPTNSTVLNNLAYMLAQSDLDPARSLECAKKAYDLAPGSALIMDTYGYVLYKHGRHQEAVEFLSAACQRFQSDELTVPSDVYEHLGMVREALGEKGRARQAYQQALDMGSGRLSPKTEASIKSALERLSP